MTGELSLWIKMYGGFVWVSGWQGINSRVVVIMDHIPSYTKLSYRDSDED